MRSTRRYGLAFLGGALISLCDRMHVAGGVLAYPNGGIFGQPWWVVPLFGAAGVVLLVLHDQLAAVLAGPRRRIDAFRFGVHAASFVAAYAATAFAPLPAGLLALLLAAAWAPFAYAYRSPAFLGFAAVVAVGGPAFEALFSASGAFHYLAPQLFGIPIWLPALYLYVALVVFSLARLPLR